MLIHEKSRVLFWYLTLAQPDDGERFLVVWKVRPFFKLVLISFEYSRTAADKYCNEISNCIMLKVSLSSNRQPRNILRLNCACTEHVLTIVKLKRTDKIRSFEIPLCDIYIKWFLFCNDLFYLDSCSHKIYNEYG